MGSRLGTVKEVEQRKKKDDINMFMRVPISCSHTTPGHTETASPHTPEPQTTSTQPGQSSSHVDRLTVLVEGLHERISGLAYVTYSTNSQVQMRLTTIDTQLDAIQHKLEESL